MLDYHLERGCNLSKADFEAVENEIFNRLQNRNENIVVDQFHPRLVSNPSKKKGNYNHYNVPADDD